MREMQWVIHWNCTSFCYVHPLYFKLIFENALDFDAKTVISIEFPCIYFFKKHMNQHTLAQLYWAHTTCVLCTPMISRWITKEDSLPHFLNFILRKQKLPIHLRRIFFDGIVYIVYIVYFLSVRGAVWGTFQRSIFVLSRSVLVCVHTLPKSCTALWAQHFNLWFSLSSFFPSFHLLFLPR